MPELPEVETTCRGIRPHLINRRIEQVRIHQPQLRWPVSPALGEGLMGGPVESVGRRGKYLLLSIAGGGSAIVHLGMSGSLRLAPPGTPRRPHDHIELALERGPLLRFNDPRRFGAWLWTEHWPDHPLLRSLGPEPLSTDFDGDWLYRQSRGRRLAVKNLIMDSRILVGVGNIYAAESLFLAGIHPARPAGRISLARYRKLAECIRAVLEQAIAMGGTTLRDFINSEGRPGYFRQSLRVYGRAGENCLACGRRLKTSRLGQRTTTYCPGCQH